ncbi:MAG: hypothetical protein KTR32_37190 [Granulosicoccus sp.]|nr:hypothetical protein [Granulosicoccus sp.]
MATPFSILDTGRFQGKVSLFSLPFASLSRSVFLINRLIEFGTLPEALVSNFRSRLQDELLSKFSESSSELSGMQEVFGNEMM